MKTVNNKKKVWARPAVKVLNIKKDTFSGTQYGSEGAGKTTTPPEPS